MRIRIKEWLIALALTVLAGCAALLYVSQPLGLLGQSGFTGSRVKNPDAYLLDIEAMNGTDLHTLELSAGDVLRVTFETERGSLHLEIKAPDGTSVYSGNGEAATDFQLNIRESGVYTIAVEARRAKGTLHIELEEENT
ncbi:MAG: PPC domain-containing protein [Candidatus Spyradocola sp.]